MMTALFAIAGVFGIGLVIGVVVLMAAEEELLTVAKTAARDVSGSFWAGVLWQLLAAPILTALLLACAITIIGVLAMPIAALAWALAYAGAFTLGLLAVATVIGRALVGRNAASTERSAALRGLTVGLLALSLVWFGTAFASGIPVVRGLTRLVALAFTWAVATVGLGAVVKSRIGVAKLSLQFGRFKGTRWGPASTTSTMEAPVPSWQTPTPVHGVVAARRPVSTSSGSPTGSESGAER